MKLFTTHKQVFTLLTSLFSQHKKILLSYAGVSVLIALLGVLVPYIAKLEIDQLIQQVEFSLGGYVFSSFHVFIFILGGMLLVEGISLFLNEATQRWKEYIMKLCDIQFSIMQFDSYKNIYLGFFLNQRNKKLLSDIGYTRTEVLGDAEYWTITITKRIISMTGIFVVFSIVNLWIGLFLVINVIVFYGINFFLNKVKYKNKGRLDDIRHDTWKYENMMNQEYDMVSINNGHTYIIGCLQGLYGKIYDLFVSHHLSQQKAKIVGFLNTQLFDIIIKCLIGYAILQGTESVGVMTMSMLYISQIKDFFYEIVGLKEKYHESIDRISMWSLFLDMTKKTPPSKNEQEQPLASVDTFFLKNLSFSYPGISEYEYEFFLIQKKRLLSYNVESEWIQTELFLINQAMEDYQKEQPEVIKDLSMSFKKGKVYGLVGRNGSGKTTLMHVISGYFPQYAGEIGLNGKDISHEKYDTLPQYCSIVHQTSYVFHGCTIRENMTLGAKKEYSDDELYAILQPFGLDQKIRAMRKGLKTEMGYDTDFSGGEKQIINLIRVFLQDKDILILDEGTNQLDAHNEMIIMNMLLEKKKNKIVIFITHRMHTIKKSDYIYCIQDGLIESQGTPKELMQTDSLFHSFLQEQ